MNRNGYILLVEDEPNVQEPNKRILERRGYSIRQAYTLAEARSIVEEERPLAIVLDIGLPDGSGLDFLSEIRQTSSIPVLILTAMNTPEDTVRGLEAGGDDFLTKPYELAVFLARVQTLLRRASLIPDMLSLGSIRIDNASGKAYINGEDMNLQPKEAALLQQFMQYPERIITAESLYEKVWGPDIIGDTTSVKNTISRLRLKLIGSGWTIAASRGEGYIFEKK